MKWDGFRAIVSTEDGLRVRSRRGWRMTSRLPELEGLPKSLMLDGEFERELRELQRTASILTYPTNVAGGLFLALKIQQEDNWNGAE